MKGYHFLAFFSHTKAQEQRSSATGFAVCTRRLRYSADQPEHLLFAHEGSDGAHFSKSICCLHTKAQVQHSSAKAFAVCTENLLFAHEGLGTAQFN